MIAPPPLLATQRSPRIIALLHSVSRIAIMIVIVVGCLGLLGWALDIAILKSIIPGLATMKANTALAFALAGFALLGTQQPHGNRRWFWAARAGAAIVALIGFLTLIEYLFTLDLHIDQLLIADTASSALPGRMAPATALCFCLLGLALLLLERQRGYWVASAMIFAALLIAWIAVVGYIYGVAPLYAIDAFSTIAVHTATTFIILGVGMLLAQPERGLIGLAASATAGGLMARRMLPAAIIIPLLLGWLRWQGQQIGFYDTEFGLLLMVISLTTVFTAFIWWNARLLHRLDLDRVRAEVILRESQERLAGILGSAMDALISINEAQQIVVFNTAAEQMFRCTAAAAFGQPLDRFIPTQFRDIHSAYINAFDQTGITSRSMRSPGTLAGIRADGMEFPIEATISQTVVGGQKLYTAIIRDITERKQAEAALRRSEERFAKMFQFSPTAMGIANQSNGQIIDVNEGYYRLLGYHADEVRGHSVGALNLFVDPDQRTQMIEQLRAHGSLDAYEFTLRTKSGAIREVLASAEIIDLDSEPCILSAFVDITERRHAEGRLRQQAELLEQTYDAVIVWELGGPITYWNRAAEELYGFSREEATGQTTHQLLKTVHPVDTQAFDALLEHHGHWEGELQHTTKAGVALIVESRHVCFRGTGSAEESRRLVMETNHDITQRRAVERALRQSEQLFATAFRATPAGLFITRLADGCIIDANESFGDLFGYRRDELIGHSVIDVDIYAVPEQRAEIIQRLRDHGTIRAAEITLRAKSGALLEALFSIEAIEIDGEACILGIVFDITDRKHAQEALLKSEARFHNMLDNMLEGFQVIGFDWRYLYLNDSAIRQGMQPRDALLGHTMIEVYPGIEETELFGLLRRCMNERTPHRIQNLFNYGDGTSGWFDLSIQPGPDGILVLSVDITNRKRAEAQVLATTKRMQMLADASRAFAEVGTDYQALLDQVAWTTSAALSDGCTINLLSTDRQWLKFIVVYDIDPEIPKMLRLILDDAPMGMDELSISGRIVQSRQPLLLPTFSPEQMRAVTKPEYWPLLERMGIHSMLGVPMRVQGEVIGALMLHRRRPEQPPFDADDLLLAQDLADRAALALNNARLLVQVQHELAERTKAETALRTLSVELEERVVARTAELAAANQELEAFSYSVSHDLRAPLRAIDGFSRILLEDYISELPDEAQHYFQLVRDNTQQMGHLVDDLLAFARLSRQPLNKRDVAMGDLVRQCLDELRAEQTGRQIDIQIGDLPACSGDPALLKQVWFNLLANALKYTRRRDPARIAIGGRVHDNEFIYFVKDNGVGFDMRYINKLFGVFQRMHRAEEYEGTGVGLAIVQRIIHRHGGRIWAEAAVDQGATFSFTLGGDTT